MRSRLPPGRPAHLPRCSPVPSTAASRALRPALLRPLHLLLCPVAARHCLPPLPRATMVRPLACPRSATASSWLRHPYLPLMLARCGPPVLPSPPASAPAARPCSTLASPDPRRPRPAHAGYPCHCARLCPQLPAPPLPLPTSAAVRVQYAGRRLRRGPSLAAARARPPLGRQHAPTPITAAPSARFPYAR
nr:translation initiation factor IF-2-like [Aegilops tauschii subsp. strangulata]